MAEPELLADGSIPNIHRSGIKYRVAKSEINTNWLLNAILGTKDLQITKASDEQIQRFLEIIDKGNLEMPDGSDGLLWLKKRLQKRFEDSQNQTGEAWYMASQRYGFVLEQVDIRLALRGPKKAQEDASGEG